MFNFFARARKLFKFILAPYLAVYYSRWNFPSRQPLCYCSFHTKFIFFYTSINPFLLSPFFLSFLSLPLSYSFLSPSLILPLFFPPFLPFFTRILKIHILCISNDLNQYTIMLRDWIICLVFNNFSLSIPIHLLGRNCVLRQMNGVIINFIYKWVPWSWSQRSAVTE